MFKLLFLFYYLFSSFLFCLCPSFRNRIVWFGFAFRLFYSFVSRLECSLQKMILSSFKLVLIWFAYRVFFFLVMLLG